MSADHVAAAIDRIKSDPEFAAAVLREPEAALTEAFDLEPNEWRAIHYGLAQDASRAIDFSRVEWLGLDEISGAFAKVMTPTVIPAQKMQPTVTQPTEIPGQRMQPTVTQPTAIPGQRMQPTVTQPTEILGQRMQPTVIPGQRMQPTVIPGQRMQPTVIPGQRMQPTVIPAQKTTPTAISSKKKATKKKTPTGRPKRRG